MMELDELSVEGIGPAAGIAAAALAALLAPPVRGTLRRAAVYGLAGLLTIGDGVAALLGHSRASEQPLDGAFIENLAAEARGERTRPVDSLGSSSPAAGSR